ncbi:MAG: hypothetical protein II548_03010, partial [Bacteroidales bacterium]|nr:hypothetical protein [Bacteroidales bacterium]
PLHQKGKAMMTKEEVAEVVAYCEENKVSYKQRLAELGINTWNFYDAKRKYAPKQEAKECGTECGGSDHRAPYSHRHDDADQRQPDGPRVEGYHHSVVHPCLTWTAGCATGSTASRLT